MNPQAGVADSGVVDRWFRSDYTADEIAAFHDELEEHGSLVIPSFFTSQLVETVLTDCLPRLDQAFYTVDQTHNVYLTPIDPLLEESHPFNRQVLSTKGCLADDQVPDDSPLRFAYNSAAFKTLLCDLLNIEAIYPYADQLSGINVHFHLDGQELAWHFDNSSFAVAALMQAPKAGGAFEYIPELRDADSGDEARRMNFEGVAAVLDGSTTPFTLAFEPGDLVLFRGRNSLHRVTPSLGDKPRVLVVFAYNTEPGITLSDSAKEVFYGRLS